jgi:hypothetical protein
MYTVQARLRPGWADLTLITKHQPVKGREELLVYSNRVHRVATAAFWRTFSDEGKIGPGW